MSNLAVSPYLWWTEGLALLVKLALWVTLFSEPHYIIIIPSLSHFFDVFLRSLKRWVIEERHLSFIIFIIRYSYNPPPVQYLFMFSCYSMYSNNVAVFVQARAENKTTLYPSSCKSHAALTSSEHQTVRKTGRWIIQPVRGPGCQRLTQRSSWFVSQKTSEDSQQAG